MEKPEYLSLVTFYSIIFGYALQARFRTDIMQARIKRQNNEVPSVKQDEPSHYKRLQQFLTNLFDVMSRQD